MTDAFTFLRRALALDAIASALTGVLVGAGAELLAPLFNLPIALMHWVALSLIPFIAFVGWLAMQKRPPRAAVTVAIALNAIWVAASIGLLLSGLVSPSALGYGFVIAQALAVGVFAELQYVGLTRAARAA